MGFEFKFKADKQTENYYKILLEKIKGQYELAQQARQKGFDAAEEVECQPVTDLADRAERIVGPKGVAERYRQVLEEVNGHRMNALFQIVREIIERKWIDIPDPQKRVEQAIKTGLVLMTEGVVVSPLDGLPKVLISKNPDNSPYVDVYFAGPIRAAGGSATVIPLILADYARHLLGLDRYKPTQDEVERYVEEVMLYQDDLGSQYKIKESEIRVIVQGCPVCVNGVPTEEKEVAVHRNLQRIPTNRLRGGMCLVVSEGVALKAMKIMQWARQLNLDWDWLEKIIKVEKTADRITEIKPVQKFLEGLAAGRPLLAYPSRVGGFRLRYGRTRNSGCMAKAVNPALMHLLDEFIAVGTHVKLERPGKAAQLFPCDSIDGPIVLLEDGRVEKVNTVERAVEVKGQLEKILFLGDLLVSVGDFRKTAHPLVPAPYTEEWWLEEYLKAGGKEKQVIESKGLGLSFQEALKLAKRLRLALHPKFIWYYKALEAEQFMALLRAVKKAKKEEGKALFEIDLKVKEALETIGIDHHLEEQYIVVEGDEGEALLYTFGFGQDDVEGNLSMEGILASLSQISGLEIKDKVGTWVGARMGRPEAAKEREMKGHPHVLFPVGRYGGNDRNINKAIEIMDNKHWKGLELEASAFKCPQCGKNVVQPYCRECGVRTRPLYICPSCGREGLEERCRGCGGMVQAYAKQKVDLREELVNASANLRVKIPDTVKGVKGMISGSKIPEPLEKGLLRARHEVNVFRDGTSRFELLNAPLTHFKPKEINLSVEKARELGYRLDVDGKPLERDDQLVELFTQDLVINDKGGDWLLKMSRFIDDLLEKFYGLKPYYNAKSKEDLIGEVVVGLAPHTSAGIVGRVIGYSQARLGWGHPYFFMATRRNFDGDQNSIMLLMDSLLNFSHQYLADKSGGRMDTPLVFTTVLNPSEIDDEVYEMEACERFPLEFYEKTLELSVPFVDLFKRVEEKVGKEDQYIGFDFTHSTAIFDVGPKQSMYTQLETMEEKIRRQAELQGKLKAVDAKDALERVMRSHFFPDIIGNARGFSRQKFRCTKCNTKFRRLPLKGVCNKCGNKIVLTIAEGSVRKYLDVARKMIEEYELSNHLKQRIELAEQEVNSVFVNERVTQKNLLDFV